MWIFSILLVFLMLECIPGDNMNATTIFPRKYHESLKIRRSINQQSPGKLAICCSPGFFMLSSKCWNNTTLPIYDIEIPTIFTDELQVSSKSPDNFNQIYRIPCKHGLFASSLHGDGYYLLENGSIYVDNSKQFDKMKRQIPDEMLTIDDYCLANLMGENGSFTVIAQCFPPEIKYVPIPIFYPIAIALSLPFLMITFFVYAFLTELRNIHGMTLMAYVGSLFWAYIGLVLVQLEVATTATESRTVCIVTASSTLLANEEYCPSEALIFPDENHKIIGLNKSGEIEYSSKNNHIFRHSEKINNNGTCPCLVKSCVALCCPQSHRIYKNNCVEMNETRRIKFPQVFDSLTLEISNSNQLDLINDRDSRFHLFIWDPCHGEERWRLAPWENPDDEFKFLNNGSIYLTGASENDNHIIKFEDYCLGYIDGDSFSVVRCFQNDYYDYEEESENSEKRVINGIVGVGLVLSVPFLVATFLVYSILPELGNIHGFTLRGYVGPLSVAYSGLGILQLVSGVNHHPGMCYSLAFIIHFSFLSSFFWLNVMCFDIWWTFGGFRALQGSVKQRERKKFIIYSIYAWGCASIMTGICLIMDFAPGIPDHYIKPSFGQLSCWFKDDYAKAIYFYGPMGITVLCNIFLFISTALKILKHKRDTAHQLRGMDSRRHDDNKQWFNLYLKLFIVMGINWSMEIISWLCKDTPQYVWYITDLANTLQGVIIFIIFVWKDKIKRLLLKRFVCQNRNFQSRNSTRSGYHSSASNRTCNSTVMASLHDKNRPSSDKNRGTTTDESDCV